MLCWQMYIVRLLIIFVIIAAGDFQSSIRFIVSNFQNSSNIIKSVSSQ